MKNEARKLVLLATTLLLLQTSLANKYYADITIEIDKTGAATITSTTNHPLLEERRTEEFTSKQASKWLFNITINETFSNYVYTITLPKGAAINYVKAPRGFMIEQERARGLSIKGTGQNQDLQIIIQYQLIEDKYINYTTLIITASMITIILAIIAKKFGRQKKQEKIDLKEFTQRQKEILKIIMKKKRVTQAKLLKHLSMPKSSLSRNISSLEKQGVITTKRKGMTKIIKLKKE